MPTTSSGEYVYAEPAEVIEFVQTQPENFGLSTTGSPSEWRVFVESRQVDANSHIDNYCERDFEDHPGVTLTVSTADGESAIYVASPIRDVTSVRVDGSVIESDNWHAKESGMLVRTDGRPWSRDYATVEVTGDFGYQTPPQDIQLAEKKLVDHTLVGMSQKREGMVVDAGDVSARINLPISMNKETRKILDRYRKTQVFI